MIRTHMKTIVFSIGCLLFIFFTAVSQVKAQSSIEVTATAEVIEGLTTRETAQMNFGRFSPGTQGGTIVLSPDGVIRVLGSVIPAGGSPQAASFLITGQYEATFSITLPTGPELLTRIGSDKTMKVSDWISSPAQGLGVGKLVGGGMTVSVGASLNVGNMEANPVGIYTGTFAVTFAYN